MEDGGPIYCETDPSGVLVEPWSTFSEVGFLVVVAVWARRLRGRWRAYPFLAVALPLILLGTVGGVLYHALRSHPVFLWLDLGPLALLIGMATIHLWRRITSRWWLPWTALVGWMALVAGLFAGLGGTIAFLVLAYAASAAVFAVPLGIDVHRRRGEGLRELVVASAFVVVGSLFHRLDGALCGVLPMGTLWIWHLCAAAALHALIAYLVRHPLRVGDGG